MARSAQKQVVFLHGEQETSAKKPWERLESEPPKWYLRFTRYRLMGRDRSLQACVEQEREEEQALEGPKKQIRERVFPLDTLPKPPAATDEVSRTGAPLKEVKPSVPGSWKRASVQWHWVERAEAWDVEQRMLWNEQLTKTVHLEAEFASRAYRIWILNLYADFLQRMILQTMKDDPFVPLRDRLAAIKLSQSVLKDIRKEMDKLVSRPTYF